MNQELKVIDKRMQEGEPSLPVATSPNAVVMMAMQKGYTPELIEKMMDLSERHEANEARKAFFEAVALFKAEAPPVKKDMHNKYFDSWYTSLGALLNTYNPVLGKHGLSLSFPVHPTQQTDKTMTAECRLSHRMGHSESISMTAPIDQAAIGKISGQRSRNPIQDIKSTFTYLRSATCEAILGVAGTEGTVDDDGNAASNGKISKLEEWRILCDEAGECANSPEDMDAWWEKHGGMVKKELSKADAAAIYNQRIAHKKRLKAEKEAAEKKLEWQAKGCE